MAKINRIFEYLNNNTKISLLDYMKNYYKEKSIKLNRSEVSNIFKSLAELYKDGIPIMQGLELTLDVVKDNHYKDSIKGVMNSIEEGKSLSDGFKKYTKLYPAYISCFIEIGENSGNLYKVLNGIGLFYEKLARVINYLKNSLIYPAIIFAAIIIMILYAVKNLVPTIYSLYKTMNIEPTDICSKLYQLNNLAQNDYKYCMLWVICYITAIYLIVLFIKKSISIEKMRKFKIVKNIFEYMIILLLAIITEAGINITYALKLIEASISVEFISKEMQRLNRNIEEGNTLTESLDSLNILSKRTIAIIKIHEESGSLNEGFYQLTNELEYNLTQKIKRYLSFINPLSVILPSVMILLFALTIIVPMFDNLQKGIGG